MRRPPYATGEPMSKSTSRFHILEVLGRGAQGEVALAEDRARGGRRIALKRITPSPAACERARAEFRRLAGLRHPNVARALDFGTSDDELFLAYEFVPGGSVLEAADRGLEERVALLACVLRGLTFLHVHGIVHGDLAPENIRLGEDGSIKLIDFGLSGAIGAPQPGGGTPRYMAPEILRGDPLDPRADLYSLGAVAYELLGGPPAVEIGEGGQVEHEAIASLGSHVADLPVGLVEWVHGLLALDPQAP